MGKTDITKNLNEMLFEEKIRLLSETEKAYIRERIEKAIMDSQKARAEEKQTPNCRP
jgi:hypothetical protein